MTTAKRYGIRINLAAALALLAGAAQADWPAAHQNAANNAVAPIPAQVTDVSGGPQWTTGNQNTVGGAPVTVALGRAFAPVHVQDGVTTAVTVKSFNAVDGTLNWESDPLDQGLSMAYGSSTAVVADPAEGAVYYATGNTVYRWDALTGVQAWSTEINAGNTATSPTVQRWDVVNSSLTVGGGRLFVETYGGFEPNYKQIVAIDASTGAVLWFHNDEGQGTGTPVYVEDGANSRVYTAGDVDVRCYDAATGALVWDSGVTPFASWDAGSWAFFGSLTEAEGLLYAATGDPAFFATTTTLFCADAETGDLVWSVPAPASDVPPLVLDGTVYVYGGGFPGRLASYDALTGAPGFNVVVAPADFIFRDYMAATQDRIYLTDGAYGGQTLKVIDPADGTILSSLAGYFGPVSIDSLGGVYVHNTAEQGGIAAFGTTVPVELSSITLD